MADAGGYLSAQENYAAKVNTSIGTRGTGLVEENEQHRKTLVVRTKCVVISLFALACAAGIMSAANRQDAETLKTLLPIVTAILGFVAGKLV